MSLRSLKGSGRDGTPGGNRLQTPGNHLLLYCELRCYEFLTAPLNFAPALNFGALLAAIWIF